MGITYYEKRLHSSPRCHPKFDLGESPQSLGTCGFRIPDSIVPLLSGLGDPLSYTRAYQPHRRGGHANTL
jgi:hypothetical protein